VLSLLDLVTTEKAQDFKAIVTERWQIPSQMPPDYAGRLATGAAKTANDIRPQDSMGWTFYGGTIDPAKRTRENIIFFFGMDPGKMLRVERDGSGQMVRDAHGRVKYDSMMGDLESLTDQELDDLDRACRAMEQDKSKVVIGCRKLEAMNKKVGEKLTVTSLNYPGVDLEVEVVGAFPEGNYAERAIVNMAYIHHGLDAWKQKNNGKPHPMADKCLNLMWLKVPDTETFRKLADQIMDSPSFKDPAVKVETGSSGVASYLDAYRDLLWGLRFLFVPAILITMALVIANAISISVRERRTEMAVLKVLGFSPTQVMILVLGEALLIGGVSGFLSSTLAYVAINAQGGIPFPIGFFPAFRIPTAALWWGLAVGTSTAFFGSIAPAWSARSVKVAEVFSKVS
jgi:putative ABC transport system permease protein